MRKLCMIAALAAAVMAVPAMAVDIDLTGGGGVGYFGNGHFGGDFTDVYSVALDDSSVTASIMNISLLGNNKMGDIDFSSISLGSYNFTHTVTEVNSNGWTDVWSLIDVLGNPVHLAAGEYDLTVKGHAYVIAAYAGTINATDAVPEPASWALMLGGFGLIGGVMRAQRRSTQITFA